MIQGSPRRNSWLMAASSLLVVLLACLALSPRASAALPDEFYGIMVGGNYWQTDEGFDGIEASGAEVLRAHLNWNQMNPSINCSTGAVTGTRNFSVYDGVVKRAAERGMRVLPYIYGNACGPNEMRFPHYGSVEYGPWLDFVEDVVQRYGYGGSFWTDNPTVPVRPIRTWEIWNEPNLPVNNPGGTTVQPQPYAKLMIDASDVIRTTQTAMSPGSMSNVNVLMGGLITMGASHLPIADFLDSVYNGPLVPSVYLAADAHNAFDGLSLHPYAITASSATVEARISDARTALDTYGDSDKTMWITELGWPVGTTWGITEAEQAQNLSDSFNWIRNSWGGNKIRMATWYFFRDSPGTSWDTQAGLKRLNGENRPSWCSYVSFTFADTCPRKASDQSTPAVDRDPATGHTVMAYRNSTGGISFWDKTTDGGWNAEALGGAVASGTSPAISLDPATGSVVIFFRDIYDRISMWHRASTGAAWNHGTLGSGSPGDVSANTSPKIASDPAGGSTFLTYRNTSGGVSFWWLVPGVGWVNNALGGSVAANTSPDIVWDVPSGNITIPFQNTNNRISYWALSSGTWSLATLGTGSPGTVQAGSSPSVASNAAIPQTMIPFRNTAGGISIWTWTSSSSWTLTNIGGSAASGITPAISFDPSSRSIFVPFRNSSNGISYWHKASAGAAWVQASMAGQMATGSNLSVDADAATPFTVMPFIDASLGTASQRVSGWQWSSGPGWEPFTP